MFQKTMTAANVFCLQIKYKFFTILSFFILLYIFLCDLRGFGDCSHFCCGRGIESLIVRPSFGQGKNLHWTK